ncbi:MAG: biotin--[acetyl-CoA-carboxylase] ligase [Pelagibacteraceae bacterium TMED247]|nr:biotin--[acetyl-CoA-carboxylase] ligase [Candidatus Pelagibacter sp.]RPG05807.1 MAG: biotin--[acetyl-CoA-carboxylase] ligase [Pelagibacteraceae bacterium TMED247]|tara:strand:+ start:2471 stop:3013 length:543 start_codon:yes stop_codon:yes gene_type:complete
MKLKLIKFNQVKSTNDEAIKIIRSKKIFKGIIVANFQTKGRGTMGKKWISQKGNIFASIFFELKKNMPNFREFSIINPVILKKILKKYSNNQVKIKWPNDLLIQNKKVCGILQELIKFEKKFFLIIGLGINTVRSPNSSNFKSTSLLQTSHKKIKNLDILLSIKKYYENISFNQKLIKRK